MCGIAGSFKESAPEKVELMLSQITHRGPDGQGIKNFPNGTLGHTRLAILDIDGGHQPMGFGDIWIAFNGEIYNYRELAKEYLTDIQLTTHSDTEVIVHLYRKFGPKCLNLLRGMFAFAIIQGEELFLARDLIGIKPLYCGEHDGIFYFASEIKALAQVTDEIREFPAGHWYHSNSGWHCYEEISASLIDVHNEQEASELIHNRLEEAVRMRLISDVPIGISLSGGLDSSIIAKLASQFTEHLHSFAVGMEGSEDLKAARKMANILETRHYERIYTEKEMVDILPKVIYHLESFDPALVRSAIPNYFLAEMASQQVKVILTGEGADEVYAGYDYLSQYTNPDLLQKELASITNSLHNTNLQRADRVAMAFGLEARVPFLDIHSINLGLGLPPELKVHHHHTAKYLLRLAFKRDLPEEIANRPKQKFSKGAGSSDVLAQLANRTITDKEYQSERARLLYQWNYRLPNKEALYYYQILCQYFQDRWIFPTMGRSRSL
ncbi:MAG: asparagine synthase B [Chloroflexi bacterium]|nr:asparagine synthase B [Chloroflexota bacterium]